MTFLGRSDRQRLAQRGQRVAGAGRDGTGHEPEARSGRIACRYRDGCVGPHRADHVCGRPPGAQKVFLYTNPDGAEAFAGAARQAGVKHIVLLPDRSDSGGRLPLAGAAREVIGAAPEKHFQRMGRCPTTDTDRCGS
jgi:hypothetical protein